MTTTSKGVSSFPRFLPFYLLVFALAALPLFPFSQPALPCLPDLLVCLLETYRTCSLAPWSRCCSCCFCSFFSFSTLVGPLLKRNIFNHVLVQMQEECMTPHKNKKKRRKRTPARAHTHARTHTRHDKTPTENMDARAPLPVLSLLPSPPACAFSFGPPLPSTNGRRGGPTGTKGRRGQGRDERGVGGFQHTDAILKSPPAFKATHDTRHDRIRHGKPAIHYTCKNFPSFVINPSPDRSHP